MKILKVISAYDTGLELDYTVEMQCDCGRCFETHYHIEQIVLETCPKRRFIDFNYCPYCGKKIELERLGYK